MGYSLHVLAPGRKAPLHIPATLVAGVIFGVGLIVAGYSWHLHEYSSTRAGELQAISTAASTVAASTGTVGALAKLIAPQTAPYQQFQMTAARVRELSDLAAFGMLAGVFLCVVGLARAARMDLSGLKTDSRPFGALMGGLLLGSLVLLLVGPEVLAELHLPL